MITQISWCNYWITFIFYIWADSRDRKKVSTKFLIGCGPQRLLQSCSVTEKGIEWNIKWKEEAFHAFLVHNLLHPLIQSDCSVYWSAGKLKGLLLLFLSLKFKKRQYQPPSQTKKHLCITPDGGLHGNSQITGAVNCCRKDLHPRGCRDPRFSSFFNGNLTKS